MNERKQWRKERTNEGRKIMNEWKKRIDYGKEWMNEGKNEWVSERNNEGKVIFLYQ